MSRVGELSVDITADTSRLRTALLGITGPGGSLAAIGVAATAAVAVATAAVVGFGVASVKEFADFDTKMREVFTLLPGITQEAMDEMEASVIAFSNEFGRLPSEVIPALYQAISAGVPQDNVFEFMETAVKTSIGGVTNLETAVDGLTSVVNAWGSETITATEASDIFFTAMKAGKTTVEELSNGIGRVAPIAAAAGMEFTEVGAALAALTSQGISTDEAVTGLRATITSIISPTAEAKRAWADVAAILRENGDVSANLVSEFDRLSERQATQVAAFVEMQASGEGSAQQLKDLEKAIEDTGDSLGEMSTAMVLSALEGSGLQTVLDAVEESTGGNIVATSNLFGNVRALNAVLALTSEEGAAKFNDVLGEMQNASGATNEAFEMMDTGISASWDRLTTRFNTLMVEVGDELAPMFQDAVDFIVTDVMPKLRDFVLGVFTAITTATAALTAVWVAYKTDTDGTFAAVREIVEAVGAAIGAAFDLMAAAWETVLKPVWEAIEPLVDGVLSVVGTLVSTTFGVITDVLNALAALLRGDFTAAWEHLNSMMQRVNDAIESIVTTVWNAIKAFLEGLFGGLVTAAEDRWNEMKATIETVVNGIKTWLEETWNGIKEWLGQNARDIATNAGINWLAVVDAIKAAFNGIGEWFLELWDGIQKTITDVIDAIIAKIEAVVAALTGAASAASGAVGGAVDAYRQAAQDHSTPAAAIWDRLFGDKGMATGGIVTAPMRALIGEAGPEAVIPLDRLERMIGGGDQTIVIELDGHQIMRAIAPRMVGDLRLRTGITP